MATTTANMSLVAWDQNNDLYDHDQLSDNFVKIDAHDHTSTKGVQIPTGGIEDDAITAAKVATGAITATKIAAGAVGATQLDTGYVHPIGAVIMWWRPNSSILVPTGWVVATGQTLSADNHDFPTGGTITLPDLRNKFILGAAESGTGSGVATPPSIGLSGGSHTVNLTHSHGVNSHTHTVAGHSHVVDSHFHSVGSHDHGAGTYDTDKAAVRDQKLKTDNDSVHRANTVTSAGDDGHKHAVTGRSGTAAPATDSKTPNTSSVGLTTNGATSTTDNQLSSAFDSRPSYAGLLFIMKVKFG